MTRRLAPASSRCVAKLCRSVCGVIVLSIPASCWAYLQTRFTVLAVIGRPVERVVNNRSAGRAAQQ